MAEKMHRRRVLLLCSYCGDDTPGCTDTTPCADCLVMCNVADVDCIILANHGGLDWVREQGAPPHPNDVHPDPSRPQHEVTVKSQGEAGAEPMQADTAKS